MVNDKIFHALVSRLSSRENTNLVVATISSSASLVLLGLETISNVIVITGILFPLFGITYIEITNRTIHRHDHNEIRKIIDADPDNKSDTKSILLFTKWRWLRMAIMRILLFTPIVSWFFFVSEISRYGCTVLIVISVTITVLIFTDEVEKEDK